jgi:UDP-GlcNAc:undecaprenyl-phosphate GlcNAc-1-phosphate transferase
MNNLIIYILISFFILSLISIISYKLKLVDLPNKRKIHKFPTAYTGGFALSLIYIFSIFLFEFDNQKLNLMLSTGFLIALVGLIDDKYTLNVGGKLSLQIIPIIYLIVSEGLKLNHLGDYDNFKLELNSITIPFTIISVLFLINSFNYFDGLDGSLSFTTISTLLIIYFLLNDENIKLFILVIVIPIFLFLSFNFSIFKFKKLFLGDSGSLLLGFLVAFILIFLGNQNNIHPILLAFSVSIFAYEFLAINLLRLRNNQSPFKAGRDHLHYMLLKKTKSIFKTNCYLSFLNIFIFFIGYFSFIYFGSLLSLILFIFLFFIYLILRETFKGV